MDDQAELSSGPGVVHPARDRRSFFRVLILLLAPAAMAALGSWGLARRGAYGDDESATSWAVQLPLHDLFHLLGHVDAVHGLYYLAMHAWVVVGRGPVALRLPSVLAAVATAGVVTALGRRLASSTVGVVAGLLYAISPFVTFYAQTARSYATVSLLVTIATLQLVRALDAETNRADQAGLLTRRWVTYGVLIAAAGWLNEMALLALAAHAVTLLVTGYSRRTRLHWLAAAALGTAAVGPLFAISARQNSVVSWIIRPSAHAVIGLARDLFSRNAVALLLSLLCVVVAIIPSRDHSAGGRVGSVSARWRNRGPVSLGSVALPLLIVPPALLISESLIAKPLYVPRYVLYSVIGGVLMVAKGAERIGRAVRSRLRGSPAAIPALAIVLIIAVVQIPIARLIRNPDSRERNFKPAATELARRGQPGDGVLFFGSFYRLVELGYPEDFRTVHDITVEQTPRASGTYRGVDAPYAVAKALILSYQRIWTIGRQPSSTMPALIDTQERDLLLRDYQPLLIRQFHGVSVSLWIRERRADTDTR